MKIGVAQSNAVVGDFPGNAKRLLASYRACVEQGAELVVTPELGLVGYPPRDLLFREGFVEKCLQALDYVADEVGDVPLLVGFVEKYEGDVPGRAFRNGAAWLERGAIREKFWKTLLPSYDVFDEQRYFEPSEVCVPYEWRGVKVGVTICEDLWTEDYLERPLYRRDPVAELKAGGAELIVNLSASPFQVGKPEVREKLVRDVAREHGVPIVYVNAVGAQDSLIFDGHSLAVDGRGELVFHARGFVEQCGVVDFSRVVEVERGCEEEQLYRALVLGVRDYAEKSGFSTICLGLSGGIDSALTAAIAAEAIGAGNVYGLTMPSHFSSSGSVDDSYALAGNLGISCQTVPIAEPFASVCEALAPVFAGKGEDVTEENMQARLRGLYLMSFSNKFGHLLVTTGNKSELAVGYCTIYGDMCGGLAVIADLPKTKVYAVSRWLNREREVIPWNTIEKAPSAELRPGQKDQDTLPEYDVLDAILAMYVEEFASVEEILARGFEENLVRWIQRRVDLNEWKRQQAALGLRVTSKAFGLGRRMPIVQRFSS